MTLQNIHQRLKVLLIAASIEESQSIQALLEEIQGLSCRVHAAASLTRGLEALADWSFDLILLDLFLPDSSGIQTLEQTSAAAADRPVVLLLDTRHARMVSRAARIGIQGVVFKERMTVARLSRTIDLAVAHGNREQTLLHQEGKFRKIIENMQDAYYETTFSDRLQYVNNTACRHFGRTREQLVGMRSNGYISPEVHKRVYDTYTEVYRTGIGGKVANVTLLRPDGSVLEVELRMSLLRDDQGAPVCFSGISRDVSEYQAVQKALQSSKEKYRKILESLEDSYFEVDLTGRMLFFNHTSEGLYGYSLEEMQGMDNRSYMDEENAKKVYDAYHYIYKTGKTVKSLQYKAIAKDGSIHYVESSISLMKDSSGRPVGFRGVGRNITARKAFERELVLAKEKAEEATRAKSEFLANMSHEIRTPMNGIIGMYNLLENTPLTPEQFDFVKTGKLSADNLLTVINDILDYSKLEAGKLEMECIDFDLRKTIDDLVAVPAHQARAKGLELVYSVDRQVPALLKGDPGRLRQIVLNLMANAVKFTEAGEVSLSVHLEREDAAQVTLRFCVHDTGIGISGTEQTRLFKSFQQVDNSTTRRYGGTGLGLAIVRQLVALMGGTMGVESEAGVGSTFWFTAEFAKGAAAPQPVMMVPDELKLKRILIVDDSKTNLDILEGYLKQWGCDCDRAAAASVALTMIKAMTRADAPYDLVISDMLMPGMDGAELARRIRADQDLVQPLLIMLTSQGLRGDAAEMKRIGYSAYLTKPVRPSILFDCVSAVLSRGDEGLVGKKQDTIITRHILSEDKRRQVRILLAEDNAINRKFALHLLSRFGFIVDAVQNGRQAMTALADQCYDLVLMDVEMPEMDGFTATRNVRDPQSNVLNHDVPVIAMTARETAQDRQACLTAGMNDYIAKPIQPDELLRVIEQTVTGQRDDG